MNLKCKFIKTGTLINSKKIFSKQENHRSRFGICLVVRFVNIIRLKAWKFFLILLKKEQYQLIKAKCTTL